VISKSYTIALLLIISFVFSCKPGTNQNMKETWKQEIRDAELSFAKLLSEEGMHKAFVTFASEDAVLLRNDSIINGKKEIDLFYKHNQTKKLTWSPDFVDVSNAGDLGYTYGHYVYSYKDSTGQEQVVKGIFHTVWKRQADGSWRFVWD
jgi:ketosteroid isomerase-like protein